MASALTEQTRLVVVTDPHNPTGALASDEELSFQLARPLSRRVLLEATSPWNLIGAQLTPVGDRLEESFGHRGQAPELPGLTGDSDGDDGGPEPSMHVGVLSGNELGYDHAGVVIQSVDNFVDVVSARVRPPRPAYWLSSNEARYARQRSVGVEQDAQSLQLFQRSPEIGRISRFHDRPFAAPACRRPNSDSVRSFWSPCQVVLSPATRCGKRSIVKVTSAEPTTP